MTKPPLTDGHHLLPRFRARGLRVENPLAVQAQLKRNQARALEEASDAQPRHALTKPGDAEQLRGIPVVGGVAGVVRGTHPEAETMRKAEQARRLEERIAA